jgi:acyl-CoA thioester hydrolase
MAPTTAGEPGRIEVPEDPRDLPGTFPHRVAMDVHLNDTDAMGHMNNSRYLTFCESARVEYWERVTGRPFPVVSQGATESMILADIRVTFRSPVFMGEVLTVETRCGGVGRTSFTLEHRITAPDSDRGSARLVATAEAVQVLFDYRSDRPMAIPASTVARLEAFEGRALR